ncbi:hypothetical protein B0H67DRAFT_91751 [Lasiosphaeris hirsuta]|uniref:Uncharacterized protein n=1 Tax=Lasiosphaeris hirsuta TaxID=260670 RepID=A0AA40BCZ2_9PEZI|nr:hypothetical protein B0H67DRAFT_91751 [Lasiosphaeris hirsuta]
MAPESQKKNASAAAQRLTLPRQGCPCPSGRQFAPIAPRVSESLIASKTCGMQAILSHLRQTTLMLAVGLTMRSQSLPRRVRVGAGPLPREMSPLPLPPSLFCPGAEPGQRVDSSKAIGHRPARGKTGGFVLRSPLRADKDGRIKTGDPSLFRVQSWAPSRAELRPPRPKYQPLSGWTPPTSQPRTWSLVPTLICLAPSQVALCA